MEWELSKENVQPLRKGRKMKILNEGLKAKIDTSTNCILSEKRRVKLQAIDDYVGDDPLEPWLQCIEWTKEAFPSGGTQSGILPMLELCLRTFSNQEKYRDDLRYLMLWMEYANRCTEPRDIYKFLEVNNIGQTHALFYESYASYLEKCKAFSKANEVLRLGICRTAAPVEKLKAFYKGFLARSGKQHKPEEMETYEEVRSFGPSTKATRNVLSARNTTTRPLQKSVLSQSSTNKLPVFVDPQFQVTPKKAHAAPATTVPVASLATAAAAPAAAPVAAAALVAAAAEITPMWSKLATQYERSKENVQQAAKWTDAKVHLKNSKPSAPSIEAIDVFVDKECQRNVESKEKKSTLTKRLKNRMDHIEDLKREYELLKQTPLRNFDTSKFR